MESDVAVESGVAVEYRTLAWRKFAIWEEPRAKLSGRHSAQCAPVAQRLEQQTHNLLVRGSNPCGGTTKTCAVADIERPVT